MDKPKHVSYQTLFMKWRLVIGGILGIAIYSWAIFFLPDPVLQWIAGRAKIIGDTLSPVFSFLGVGALSTAILFLIGDPLGYGRSEAAQSFQAEFPSKKIATKYGIELGTAIDYFLRYYDCWQFDSEPEHNDYLQTTHH